MEGRNRVFSKFGGLGGDCYKGTHEAKMIGMHNGSVLSGLEAGNVCTEGVKNGDYFEIWRSCRGVL